MRDRYRGNSAKRIDQRDRVRIDKANAVPKDIPFTCAHQQRPLSDSKIGYRLNTPNSFAFLKKCVPVGLLQFLQRDPLLALQTDELPLVLADGAVLRRVVSLRKLRSASHTEMRHVRFLS